MGVAHVDRNLLLADRLLQAVGEPPDLRQEQLDPFALTAETGPP
jgi:hypothetical protein